MSEGLNNDLIERATIILSNVKFQNYRWGGEGESPGGVWLRASFLAEDNDDTEKAAGGRETMRFRKKPVVIEAQRFRRGVKPWPVGVVETFHDGIAEEGDRCSSSCDFAIDTLEGRALNVMDGDWIITGVKGERYPCKPDIFEATYEPADVR